MNFLGCELDHFHPNAITALSCFAILCERWLGIAPYTSLFWYFYSPIRYTKVVYTRVGLSLRRHHSQQYIKATFKSSWKDSQKKWFLVDIHVQLQWVNKLLFLPFIKDKWGEPSMMPRLAALVKRVAELHEARLKAYHCVEEFTLRQIHPLSHQEKLAFNCPRLANPNREPADGEIFIL
jgi:hypothetical protein